MFARRNLMKNKNSWTMPKVYFVYGIGYYKVRSGQCSVS